MIEDLIPIAQSIMEKHDVRCFGEESTKDDFGKPMLKINGHFNDLIHCNIDALFNDLGKACNAEVAYTLEGNRILIRPY